MTGLLLVVCSMTLAQQLQMHDHQYGTARHINATCAEQNIHSPKIRTDVAITG